MCYVVRNAAVYVIKNKFVPFAHGLLFPFQITNIQA